MKKFAWWQKRFISAMCVGLLSLGLSMGTADAFSVLQRNSQGPEVLQVQQQLQALGYKISKLNGIFDNSTYRAVLAFQRDNKIKINGTVDDATYRALQKAKPMAKPSSSGAVKPGSAAVGTVRPGTGSNAGVSWTELNSKAKQVPESQPFLAQGQVPKLIATAKKYIGVPYKMGGNTPKAFDCSGYLQYVFAQHNMKLPRTADLQYKLGKNMSAGKLEAGDLVFFSTYEKGASHCGIYLGNGQFIHASSSKGVRIDKLSDSYWKKCYYGGKHIVK